MSVICYNCKKENPPEVALVKCGDDPACSWSLYVCVSCVGKMGDGSQHAVIEARAHSATHKPFMVVRLHPDSDSKGMDIGHASNESEIKGLITGDLNASGPADYLVMEKASKRHLRINMRNHETRKAQSQVSSEAKAESPMEKAFRENDASDERKPKSSE